MGWYYQLQFRYDAKKVFIDALFSFEMHTKQLFINENHLKLRMFLAL